MDASTWSWTVCRRTYLRCEKRGEAFSIQAIARSQLVPESRRLSDFGYRAARDRINRIPAARANNGVPDFDFTSVRTLVLTSCSLRSSRNRSHLGRGDQTSDFDDSIFGCRDRASIRWQHGWTDRLLAGHTHIRTWTPVSDDVGIVRGIVRGIGLRVKILEVVSGLRDSASAHELAAWTKECASL